MKTRMLWILAVGLTFTGLVYAQDAVPAADTAGQPASSATPVAAMQDIWNTICQYIAVNGINLVTNLVIAALIFFIGRWLAQNLSDLIEKALNKAKVDTTLSRFSRNLIYSTLLVFIVIAALDRLGVRTASFVAIIGAAGLAVGLALQGSLSNFAAGVMLIIFKPIRVGDFVDVAGVKGTVAEIQIFVTILDTPDNVRIFVPNAQITGGNIINFSANSTRRLDMVIGVSYGDDLAKAKQTIMSVLLSDSRVLRTPEPVVAILGLGDSSVNIAVRPWVKATDYWDEHFSLHEKIKLALEQNGLTIPFPQRDIHIRTGLLKP